MTQRLICSDSAPVVDICGHPHGKTPLLPNSIGEGSTVPEGHELTMWLRKAYLAFHRHVNAWMLRYGITADQYILLCIVARSGYYAEKDRGEDCL